MFLCCCDRNRHNLMVSICTYYKCVSTSTMLFINCIYESRSDLNLILTITKHSLGNILHIMYTLAYLATDSHTLLKRICIVLIGAN